MKESMVYSVPHVFSSKHWYDEQLKVAGDADPGLGER